MRRCHLWCSGSTKQWTKRPAWTFRVALGLFSFSWFFSHQFILNLSCRYLLGFFFVCLFLFCLVYHQATYMGAGGGKAVMRGHAASASKVKALQPSILLLNQHKWNEWISFANQTSQTRTETEQRAKDEMLMMNRVSRWREKCRLGPFYWKIPWSRITYQQTWREREREREMEGKEVGKDCRVKSKKIKYGLDVLAERKRERKKERKKERDTQHQLPERKRDLCSGGWEGGGREVGEMLRVVKDFQKKKEKKREENRIKLMKLMKLMKLKNTQGRERKIER